MKQPPTYGRADELKIVRERLSYLAQYAPSVSRIEQLGAGIAVYGPSTGAALITRYTQTAPDTYAVEEVSTWSDKARALFMGGDGGGARLRFNSAHDFRLGGVAFNDERHFAAFFSANGVCPS
jgi:hypothetical protein